MDTNSNIDKKKRGGKIKQNGIDSAVAKILSEFLRKDKLSFSAFSQITLDYAQKVTKSPYGFAGYIDESGYMVAPTLTKKIWDKCRVRNKKIVFKEFRGLWGWVLKNRKSVICNNPQKDKRSEGVPTGHIRIKRFLAAPAMCGKKIMGMVAVANAKKPYLSGDLKKIQTLANFYAVGLDRKIKEDKIKLSEKKYRLLYNVSPDIIYTIDSKGIIRHINESVRNYGYSPEEIIGKPAENFCHKDDIPLAYEALDRAFKTGKTLETALIFRMLRKDGKPFYVEQKSKMVFRRGKPHLIIAFARDLSFKMKMEKKVRESEELIKTIFDLAKDAIFIKDRQGRYIRSNKMHSSLYRMAPEEMGGKTDFDFMDKKRAERIRAQDKDVMKQGKTLLFEEERETKDGVRFFNILKTPLCDSSGKIIGMFGIARDITRIKRMEEELIHRRAIEEARKITDSAAHDFNNVLAAIKGYAMLMLEEIDKKNPMRTEIEEIAKAVGRAVKITEKLQPEK